MEDRRSSVKSFKEQFDDQLTCSVCLDQYTNPKALPCLHSFCLKCIEPIPVEIKAEKCYICCPTCRVDHQLPQGGARSLPSAFHINSLLDLQKEFSVSEIRDKDTCPKHDYPFSVYCETCCQVICRDCTISTEHNKHTYYLISECYQKHYLEMLDDLIQLKQKTAEIDAAILSLDAKEKEVKEQGGNIKQEINEHAQQLIDSIKQSQTRLTQQVDTIVQQKTQTLATQRQQAQKLHTRLKKCQENVEKIFEERNESFVLQQKHEIIKNIKTKTENADPTIFHPLEDSDITLEMKMLPTQEIGCISSCTFESVSLKTSPCLAKQPSTATLTLNSHDGSVFPLSPSLVSSTLHSPGKYSMKCAITQIEPGRYEIAFTTATRKNQLIIQVGGVEVPNSPFTLPVIPTPEMRIDPINIIIGWNHPWGIAACDNGDIVVAQNSAHCVTIFNRERRSVTSFGTKGTGSGCFMYPRGVAVTTDGHILVTDNHRLQKLTKDGSCVKSVGTETSGSGQLQFNSPEGIEVNPTTGQIFVADSLNDRIQVFTNDLVFSHTIAPSKEPFKNPYDVTIDDNGYLYVADTGNHCVKKLTDKGKLVKRLGCTGSSSDSQLQYPSSIVVHYNLLYISDWGNNITSICNKDGEFIHSFELHHHDKLLFARLAIDAIGNLYVTYKTENKIVIF